MVRTLCACRRLNPLEVRLEVRLEVWCAYMEYEDGYMQVPGNLPNFFCRRIAGWRDGK